MDPKLSLQLKGLTAVGIIAGFLAVVFAFFWVDMNENALMGASQRYRAEIPAVPAVDITKAPQCKEGYDKNWVGCQGLAQ